MLSSKRKPFNVSTYCTIAKIEWKNVKKNVRNTFLPHNFLQKENGLTFELTPISCFPV